MSAATMTLRQRVANLPVSLRLIVRLAPVAAAAVLLVVHVAWTANRPFFGWREQHILNDVSVLVPTSMTEVQAQGIDSYIRRFEQHGLSIQLSYDLNVIRRPTDDVVKSWAGVELIDGVPATLGREPGDPVTGGSTVLVNFPSRGISGYATASRPEGAELAARIFRTFSFHASPKLRPESSIPYGKQRDLVVR
jgi:hypothetical protein